MNHTQAARLALYVQACCPAQKINEMTPDAFHNLLGDLDYDEAEAAATRVARRQTFVSPSDIIAEVKRARRARIDTDEHQLTGAPTDPDEYRAWLARQRDQIASGHSRDLPQIEASEGKHQVSADFIHQLRLRAKREQARRNRNSKENS